MKKKIGFILGLALCLIIFGADKVWAEELSKYASLHVQGERLVDKGIVVKKEKKDDSGRGSAVYDSATNTLTVTNCQIKSKSQIITANFMGDDFTIVFRGVNRFETETFVGAITLSNNGAHTYIKGDGVVYANEGIDFESEGNLEIEGVTFHLTPSHYGIAAHKADVKIRNALINVAIENKEKTHPLTCGIYAKSLEVEHSNITTKVPEAGTKTIAGLYDPRAIFVDPSGGIKLSPDMTVTNAAGEKLYLQTYYGGTAVGNMLVYTTYQDWIVDAHDNIYKISNTVNITSQTKTKELADNAKVDEVVRLISEIGTVNGQSGNAIEKARKAYDALSTGLKQKVTNYSVLLSAESTYNALKKVGDVKIKSVKSKKAKQAVIKWKKVDGSNGYEIAYSKKNKVKNGKLKNAKVKTVKKGNATSLTLKKLQSGTYYYVQIRAYKIVGGKKIYGKWSKPKKVKIK